MKAWYLSKTLWLNIIGAIILLLQYAGTINWLPQTTAAEIIAVLNIILRIFFTSTQLTSSQPVDTANFAK